MAKETVRLGLELPPDVSAWVAFAAGAKDVSKNAYVVECIRAAMENAPEQLKEAYEIVGRLKTAI